MGWLEILKRIDDYRWELPQDYKPGMQVPALIYADRRMLQQLEGDQAIEQAANVAILPGIIGRSLAMPDIHWGYGFPIGGVAAMQLDGGVVSPGGVGFDINCGTRVITTKLHEDDLRPILRQLVNQLYRDVPPGIGGHGDLRVNHAQIDAIMVRGARWMVEHGYGESADLDACESGGALPGADPGSVSQRARERGLAQLGTIGSGNHFLEVQAVDQVYDAATAKAFGIQGPGQAVIFFHCGSRGFGHQVCQDYLRVTRRSREELGLDLLYDVAHNIAKVERHRLNGREADVCVHRKGATRAFPPGHPDVPPKYRNAGQPVLVPGDMGRYSFLAVGTRQAMEETWGSTCHGAGRVQSRGAAKRMLEGVDVAARMAEQGIIVRAQNMRALAEEASEAYKDVANVIDVLEHAGISRKVARMKPIGVIKG
jgi:tRNA-splicing ligase RtcB